VKKQTFHFEIKDVLTQFIAAFDDIIIKRYDKNRVPANDVQVRYVYSPKQRVLYDLVNRAQNITIPVVAVSINGISRDETRVFNKIEGYYFSKGLSENDHQPTAINYKSPVPVNIGISMSILTKFQSDMDQILSNFIPYNNPYIIISWKVPESVVPQGFSIPQEIRSEVVWDGTVRINYPTDINASQKYQVIGDTSFTIKGWLFPAQRDEAKTVYYIDSNFYNSRQVTLYSELTGDSYVYPTSTGFVNNLETISVSGFPQVTNTINYSYPLTTP
jgi:hypothetical protein